MSDKTFKVFICSLSYQFRDSWQDSPFYCDNSDMGVIDDLSMYCMM